ncbi:MAG TPA: MFS transporter [Thermomicrobiaceae bacterium]|nr:MFS transporter [Thermomicrobiaceae bacterium]
MASTFETASEEDRLPLRTKLLWGWAGLGAEALTQSRHAWLVYFYAPPLDSGHPARLPLLTVTLLLFAGKLFEAGADTLVGYWSDRTSSRLGRRVPFVLAGAPPMAVFAVLLFAPPSGAHGAALAAWFFIALELFFLFQSVVGVPYEALLPEIARGSAERVALSAWRVAFGVLGAGVGLVGSGLLIGYAGFRAMALAIALLAVAGRYVGVAAVWRRVERGRPPAPPSLGVTLRLTLANRGFLVFMLSFVLFSSALAMLTGLLPYYVHSLLGERDPGTWAGLLTAVAIGSMALAIPLFARLSRRTSQRHAYRRAMLLSALAFPLLFVAGSLPGPAPLAQALAAMVIVGAPLAGVFLFPGPIIADLCDADAAATGLRREGMFYSVQSFMDKLTGACAPLLLGLILLLGDSPGHLLGIRLVGPAAGLLVLAGYLALRAYEHAERGAPAREPQAALSR